MSSIQTGVRKPSSKRQPSVDSMPSTTQLRKPHKNNTWVNGNIMTSTGGGGYTSSASTITSTKFGGDSPKQRLRKGALSRSGNSTAQKTTENKVKRRKIKAFEFLESSSYSGLSE